MAHDVDPDAFARDWIDLWNAKDVDAIVAHYSDDFVFVSPTAERVTGSAVVTGLESLRDYWQVVHTFDEFVFIYESHTWDAAKRALAIVYRRIINGNRDRAVEFFTFNDDGLVSAGEALYGATWSET